MQRRLVIPRLSFMMFMLIFRMGGLVRHCGAYTQQIWLVIHYWNRLLRWSDCIHYCSFLPRHGS